MLLAFKYNRTFYSLILLVFSCSIVFSDSVLETSNITADASPAAIALSTAKCWSQVFFVPKEGYKILRSLQPAPCRNLFRPPVLIPVSEMNKGCMPFSVVKKISPTYNEFCNTYEMGYVVKYGLQNGHKAAKSWLLIHTMYTKKSSWRTLVKLCSIDVNEVPHIGVAIVTGMLWEGAIFTPASEKTNPYGEYFIKQCEDQ